MREYSRSVACKRCEAFTCHSIAFHRGENVTIAVIDTGIDYTHEDLVDNYVTGGYDRVNNDSNPMDDHHHGTHCAGIAAATIETKRELRASHRLT